MARLSASSSAITGNDLPNKPDTEAPIGADGSSNTNSTIPGYRYEAYRVHEWPPRSQFNDPSLAPGGKRSLSSISLQAFTLGLALSFTLSTTLYLATYPSTLWRLPAFFAALSLFHFLEFWTTARFNTPVVKASSFLLFNNGRAYNIAHSLATLEIIVSYFLPSYQSLGVNVYTIIFGTTLVLLGQLTRSLAMAQAGTNFNHVVAHAKSEGHVLVTSGVYGLIRHPSYCGFFWWGIGTQLMVGNKLCALGYAVALWGFFHKRIRGKFQDWIKVERVSRIFSADCWCVRRGDLADRVFWGGL